MRKAEQSACLGLSLGWTVRKFAVQKPRPPLKLTNQVPLTFGEDLDQPSHVPLVLPLPKLPKTGTWGRLGILFTSVGSSMR